MFKITSLKGKLRKSIEWRSKPLSPLSCCASSYLSLNTVLIQKGSNMTRLIFRELKQKHESEDEEEMRKVVTVFMPLNPFFLFVQTVLALATNPAHKRCILQKNLQTHFVRGTVFTRIRAVALIEFFHS